MQGLAAGCHSRNVGHFATALHEPHQSSRAQLCPGITALPPQQHRDLQVAHEQLRPLRIPLASHGLWKKDGRGPQPPPLTPWGTASILTAWKINYPVSLITTVCQGLC